MLGLDINKLESRWLPRLGMKGVMQSVIGSDETEMSIQKAKT